MEQNKEDKQMYYYIVMVTPVGNIDMQTEYTGTYYKTRTEARDELLKAVQDPDVGTVWIERIEKDLKLEYKEA